MTSDPRRFSQRMLLAFLVAAALAFSAARHAQSPLATALAAKVLDLMAPAERLLLGLAGQRHPSTAGSSASRRAEGSSPGQLEQQLALLRHEIQSLRHQTESAGPLPGPPHATQPLVAGELLQTRLLAQQVLADQTMRQVLDLGSADGAAPDQWVLAPLSAPGQIDLGADHQLDPGQLVLADRRVWGRLKTVGRSASTVERVTDAAFREVVLVVSARGPQAGAWTAMLEGTGQSRARIRGVPATEPVAVGDWVLSATERHGTESLCFGQVSSAERTPEATQWELWMRPAVELTAPARLYVWRWKPNERRLAARPPAGKSTH